MSAIDLLTCATAAHRGLTVLHDDTDYTVAARILTDVSGRFATYQALRRRAADPLRHRRPWVPMCPVAATSRTWLCSASLLVRSYFLTFTVD
jgi:hypothetical protein